MGDVAPFLAGGTDFVTQDGEAHSVPRWHLIIAHPPCTYLTKLGSVHLYREDGTLNWARYRQMILARRFFLCCLHADAPFVAVENPIPMRRANLPHPDAYACPSWYGVKYTKKTLYWLKNLPPLVAQVDFPNPKSYVHCSRGKYRSRTFPAMADAIATQWGHYVLSHFTDF